MPTWAAILIGVCGCTGIFNLATAILQHRWSKQDKQDTRFEEMQKKQDERFDETQRKQDERFDEIKEDLSHMKQAQRSSMEERIRYLVSHWYNKGIISMAEKANLIDMWKMYVGVGGNGNLDTEMEILNSIPVEKHE